MGLKIYLLGQFKIQARDLSIELPSRPAQSLLAYLVLNGGVTHRRERLAGLIWPETTETNARSYLRQALWRIRKALEGGSLVWEDYLQINDISVSFDSQADYWLDAETLLEAAEGRPVEEIIEIVSLYQGELLPGFYDEWILPERDRLQAAFHQKMNLLLACLIQSGRWDDAVKWGEQWIRLGQSPEPAFRALMSAYAGLGDPSMVSVTYQRCVDSINRELGLEPSPQTQRLHERLLCGEPDGSDLPPIHAAELAEMRPSFLDQKTALPVEKTVFVARENELAQLDSVLCLALAGQGRVMFTAGEAGSGKTALVSEFVGRAQDSHGELVVAIGNCNAHTGIGDPYLPFREILALLTGDVEARYAAGAITFEHARLLWNTLPLAAQAMVDFGPDLIDAFVPSISFRERAHVYAPNGADWLNRLDELLERKSASSNAPSPGQSDLFEQYTRVVTTLARNVPLLLVVDDLQWADLGSISLLFHLGRHIVGSKILIVCAYRPEEVALGRDGSRHPLEPVVNEFQREYGDSAVNLDQASSRDFVRAILDSEPNRLGVAFRDMLYQQTRGHPLFTVELLRGMQERGDLVRDQGGRWIEGPELDWETLPARVEAVIAERIGRLDQPLRAALRVASVEGEVFTAELVARVRQTDEREMLTRFSRELDRRHRLIWAQSILRMDGRRLSRYRFRNYLFQKYLYDGLDQVERAYLHEDVGNLLEELYGDHGSEIAVQLAWHFREAGIAERAIHYLRQAGERAVHVSAYQEGIAHLNKGLAMLETLPDSPERAQNELDLQLALGIAIQGTKGARSPERKEIYTRARHLCQHIGEKAQLCHILGEMAVFHYVGAEHQIAHELAKEALGVAQQTKDPLLVALGHWYLGVVFFSQGKFVAARQHLEQMISFYEPQQHHHPFVSLRGKDAGLSALAYHACCLWCLGYPEQALKRSQEALVQARELGHPFSLADVLSFAGCLFDEMRQESEALRGNAEEMMQLSLEKVPGWNGTGDCYRGEALARLGQVQEGITQIRDGMAARSALGVQCYMSGALRSLSEAQAKAGHPEEALTTLAETLAFVEETDERYCEADIYRLQAELMLMRGDDDEAETSFKRAIEVARRQGAKSWKLRAAIGLAHLWRKQGRADEAREMLVPIYGWFEEGFDTPDLMKARALLEELAYDFNT